MPAIIGKYASEKSAPCLRRTERAEDMKKARKSSFVRILPRPFLCRLNLLRLDRADGAHVLAGAAIDAGVGINDSLIGNFDRRNGTSVRASAASNAFIGNGMSHDSPPPLLIWFLVLYHKSSK